MYRNQLNTNKDLFDLYYKVYIKIEASKKLNTNLIGTEAYSIVTVYLDQADKELSVPSAYQARKNVLELLVYLRSELGLSNKYTEYYTTIRALIGVLALLKDLLVYLHKEESKIQIQEL